MALYIVASRDLITGIHNFISTVKAKKLLQEDFISFSVLGHL